MHNYSDYLSYTRKIYDVYMSMSVLNWDMETHMPKNGNRFRSQQLSTLAKIAYEMSTDPKYGDLLDKLSNDSSLDFDQKEIFIYPIKIFLKEKYSSNFIQNNLS